MLRKIISVLVACVFCLAIFNFPLDYILSLPNKLAVDAAELDSLCEIGATINCKESNVQCAAQNQNNATVSANFKLFNFFNIKKINITVKNQQELTVGGMPIGFELATDGAIVLGISDVETIKGRFVPTRNTDISRGDIIKSIDGNPVKNAQDIDNQVNLSKTALHKLTLSRNGRSIETKIESAVDRYSNRKRIGLWVRDSASGIGTLTYTDESGKFGALGHPVTDSDTGEMLNISQGTLYKCNVVGVIKGTKGRAGALSGVLNKSRGPIGRVDRNTAYGVYGAMDLGVNDNYKYRVGNRNLVKPGKAQIMCTVDDSQKLYDIEIVKASKQNSPKDRSMIIKVTDPRLIETTGGIVQGMSGSPIIQNDRIIGAVTHVFINDPLKGYGLYLDWMLSA